MCAITESKNKNQEAYELLKDYYDGVVKNLRVNQESYECIRAEFNHAGIDIAKYQDDADYASILVSTIKEARRVSKAAYKSKFEHEGAELNSMGYTLECYAMRRGILEI